MAKMSVSKIWRRRCNEWYKYSYWWRQDADTHAVIRALQMLQPISFPLLFFLLVDPQTLIEIVRRRSTNVIVGFRLHAFAVNLLHIQAVVHAIPSQRRHNHRTVFSPHYWWWWRCWWWELERWCCQGLLMCRRWWWWWWFHGLLLLLSSWKIYTY